MKNIFIEYPKCTTCKKAKKWLEENKIEIKEAVEKAFGVKVEKVNTINVRGKLKRQGRTQGYTSKRKKAIVQLTKDSKAIEIFENLA